MAISERRASNVVVPASNACFLFHLGSFLLFLYVFLWHFGRHASALPQSNGFGWFFKYLTFCGFTFQTVALSLCLMSHLFPEVKGLKRSADDLSCASFSIANVVTLMYWTIFFYTSDPMVTGVAAAAEKTLEHGLNTGGPLWLSFVVHVANAGVAWIDICIAERTFRKWSLQVAMLFGFAYVGWIYVCAAKNNEYPYPFLDAMQQPDGILMIFLFGVSSLFLFFKAGSKLASRGSSSQLKKLKLI